MELTYELDNQTEPEVIKQIQDLTENGVAAKSYNDNLDAWILTTLSGRTNQSVTDILHMLSKIDELGIDERDYGQREKIEERLEQLHIRGVVEKRGERWNTKDLGEVFNDE